jgi:hypothetical protein
MSDPKIPKKSDSMATRPAPESFPHYDPPKAEEVKAEAARPADAPPIEPPADAPPPRTLHDKLFPKPAETADAEKVKDLPAHGVTTTQAPTADDTAKDADAIKDVRLRVWEGDHSAEAFIVKDNDDDTLDLSADLWHTGHALTLTGVKRRVGGQGNGWEVIDAAEEAKAKADTPYDERTGTNVKHASLALVTLTITPPFNGELQIGHTVYPVTDGVVEVAPWDADAARAAGYTG